MANTLKTIHNIFFEYDRYLISEMLDNITWGVINSKAGKAVALPKFSDKLTLSQPEERGWG